jgi:hypothetical protein
MDLQEIISAVSSRNVLTKATQQEVVKALKVLQELKKIGIKELPEGGENMNAYLNADEQSYMLKLGAMASFFQIMVATYRQLKRYDKRFVALMDFCGIAGELALHQRMKHMNQTEKDKILEKIKSHQVIVGPKDQIYREMEKAQKTCEFTVFTADEVCDWVGIDIENYCRKCTLKGQDIQDCYLRQLWVKHDVAPLYEDCPNDQCPYRYGDEWRDHEPMGNVEEAYSKAIKVLGEAG